MTQARRCRPCWVACSAGGAGEVAVFSRGTLIGFTGMLEAAGIMPASPGGAGLGALNARLNAPLSPFGAMLGELSATGKASLTFRLSGPQLH